MKMNLKKNQGSVALESAILFPLFLSIIFLTIHIINFNNKTFAVLYATAQTARYASLASTTTTQEITDYANNLLLATGISETNTTVNITAPSGITIPGATISIQISLDQPNNINPLPTQITKTLSIRKEGVI